MAQLFCILFDEYYFDPQKSFEVTFKPPFPFKLKWVPDEEENNPTISVGIVEVSTDDGNESKQSQPDIDAIEPKLYVESVDKDQLSVDEMNSELQHQLVPGLRVVQIVENSDGIASSKQVPLNREEFDIETADEIYYDGLTVSFIEEIDPSDISEPLGLTWESEHDEKEGTQKQKQHTLKGSIGSASMSLMNRPILSIGASSYTDAKFHPRFVRYRSPSCWKPSMKDETTLDTWIRVDLGAPKVITKIRIRGNPETIKDPTKHEFIKSFWIDSSNDCCEWRSHPTGEMVIDSKDMLRDNECDIQLFPAIFARFIRLRPYGYHNHIALQFELYGFQELSDQKALFARLVEQKNVTGRDKRKLLEKISGLPPDTKVWQVDCKTVIRSALHRANQKIIGFLKCVEEDPDDASYLCLFSSANAVISENVINELTGKGIGRDIGVLSVSPITFRKPEADQLSEAAKKVTKKSFASSIRSRMFVQQVIDRVNNSADLTFDYLTMLIVAALIAAGGLATDNAVIVVASMLVSPLMGPVLAMTFGTSLPNRELAMMGIRNESLSLFICILVGFVFGIPYIWALENEFFENWPTEQMLARGTTQGLIDGVLIATPSGIGVALSVLGEYASTVIGVAISASLLPPAVNTGIFFALAIYSTTHDTPHIDAEYSTKELMLMAVYSLLLTLENILIIYATAIGMFWVKKVVNIKGIAAGGWKNIMNYKRAVNTHHSNDRPALDAAPGLSRTLTRAVEDDEMQGTVQSTLQALNLDDQWVRRNLSTRRGDTKRSEVMSSQFSSRGHISSAEQLDTLHDIRPASSRRTKIDDLFSSEDDDALEEPVPDVRPPLHGVSPVGSDSETVKEAVHRLSTRHLPGVTEATNEKDTVTSDDTKETGFVASDGDIRRASEIELLPSNDGSNKTIDKQE